MNRLAFALLVLVACKPPKPATFYEPGEGPGAEGSAAEEPAGSATAPETTPATTTPETTTTVEPPKTADPPPKTVAKTPPVPGTAAYCLYVGPEERVVRCYWERAACDEQITFNKDYGVDKAQVCKGVAEAHCLVSDKTERCYPTAGDCEENVAGIRKQKRQTTDCVAKKRP